ncbi:TRAP transporter substrate-binding protein DctP [Chloroflexota bacterium]
MTYYAGIIPEMYIFGCMPFSWPDMPTILDFYYQYGGVDILNEVHAEHNVTCLPEIRRDVLNVASTFPCDSPDDLKGKKIRVYAATAKIIEALGGLPVTMAIADIYQGLALGTVDGATIGINHYDTQKLYEVAPHYTVSPSILNSVGSFLINNDSLNALPEDMQDIVLNSWRFHYLGGALMEKQLFYLAESVKEYGAETHTWSEADTAKVRELAQKNIWPEYASASPRCAKK